MNFQLITKENDEENLLGNSKYKYAWKARLPMMDCTLFIPYLRKEFLNKGGKLKIKKVKCIKSLVNKVHNEFDIIVNCSGFIII
jgi:hypothetical protein